MSTNRLKFYLKNPRQIYLLFAVRGFFNWMPDDWYLKMVYKLHIGEKLNLKKPKTFNEKLQWLKIYNRKPEYTKMVDKYEAKKYVADIIGEEYVIPTLGVWDRFEEIDFGSLPSSFVLKCTHDSGGLVIVKDKAELDVKAAKRKIKRSLSRNYYWMSREWPYKNIRPRIIAEKYMTDESGIELKDYKFFCFNGRVDCVMVCIGRSSGDTKFYFFDKAWKLLRYNIRGKNAPENFTIPKPSNMEEMFDIAEKLSVGLSFSRIDLYSVSGKTYFGEVTFFPDGGFDANLLPEADTRWGEMIDISKIDSDVKDNV